MTTLDRSIELNRDYPAVETTPSDDTQLANASVETNREQWQMWLNDYLIEWGRAPERIADEDLEPPTVTAIQKAYHIVRTWTERMVAPHRVIPDGEGGITFEWRQGPRFYSLEIDESGESEVLTFEACRLTERSPVIS